MSNQKEVMEEGKPRPEDLSSKAANDKSYQEREYALESQDSPNGGVVGNTPSRRGLQPPAFLARLSPEERMAMEAKLKRKIDLRLMPTIIIMYILNYIDRYVALGWVFRW
jgi:hypothetical protein